MVDLQRMEWWTLTAAAAADPSGSGSDNKRGSNNEDEKNRRNVVERSELGDDFVVLQESDVKDALVSLSLSLPRALYDIFTRTVIIDNVGSYVCFLVFGFRLILWCRRCLNT